MNSKTVPLIYLSKDVIDEILYQQKCSETLIPMLLPFTGTAINFAKVKVEFITHSTANYIMPEGDPLDTIQVCTIGTPSPAPKEPQEWEWESSSLPAVRTTEFIVPGYQNATCAKPWEDLLMRWDLLNWNIRGIGFVVCLRKRNLSNSHLPLYSHPLL